MIKSIEILELKPAFSKQVLQNLVAIPPRKAGISSEVS